MKGDQWDGETSSKKDGENQIQNSVVAHRVLNYNLWDFIFCWREKSFSPLLAKGIYNWSVFYNQLVTSQNPGPRALGNPVKPFLRF